MNRIPEVKRAILEGYQSPDTPLARITASYHISIVTPQWTRGNGSGTRSSTHPIWNQWEVYSSSRDYKRWIEIKRFLENCFVRSSDNKMTKKHVRRPSIVSIERSVHASARMGITRFPNILILQQTTWMNARAHHMLDPITPANKQLTSYENN